MKGHPSLRRLLAFGTTPRLSVEVIRRREKALTRLVRELDLPLVDEAPIEPLFRELDGFASLARAVGRANSARSEVSATKPPRSEQPMPWSRASVASEQASVPGKPREREAPGRTTRAHCERATQRRAPPGEPISEQSQRAVAARRRWSS